LLRIFSIRYGYTIEPLMHIRNLVSSKICYRPNLSFLRTKYSLTQSLSNRLVVRGNYQRSYLDLRYFYICALRANFAEYLDIKFTPYFFQNFDNKKFFMLYAKSKLTCDLDYVLYWRASQVNSLFNIATLITKKKKKRQYRSRVFFTPFNKRLHFVWKWLNVFVRSTVAKKTARNLSLIKPFENFMLAPEENNIIFDFKLQLYKLYLMRIT